ncbi:hypothetical protein E2C01_056853 [Portunus trituberculatus]|uniref:Uncharacterized protein n=1 Tax=Portunus trituberculatus TaxID=210409 RepID=A0A5B7GYI9_PORTR|nr:hypothetical protein [Portunus trituberculatus]
MFFCSPCISLWWIICNYNFSLLQNFCFDCYSHYFHFVLTILHILHKYIIMNHYKHSSSPFILPVSPAIISLLFKVDMDPYSQFCFKDAHYIWHFLFQIIPNFQYA